MNIAIIIPNWNGKEFIGDCLRSLINQSQPANIIVVDNGSDDGSSSYIQKVFPSVSVLELEKNYGFAGGVNKGIKYALDTGAEYIALFNNDAVADKDWLKSLIKTATSHEQAGIITGKLMRVDKKHIDSTGEFYSTWGLPFPRGRNQVDNGQYDKEECIFGATGGASLYKAKLFKDVGLFDEDFFAYFEDVDISFRAQLLGWKVRYDPNAIAYHHVGATSSKLGNFARYHSIKNFIMLYNKNMPGMLFWKYKILFFTQLSKMFLGCIRDHQTVTFIKAFSKALLLSPSTIKKRHGIQKHRKLSSKQLSQLLKHGRPPKAIKL